MIVSASGARLFYSIRGHGAPCVVPCSSGTQSMESMTEALTAHLELVFVDLRGSGRSTGDPADLGFDVMAADLDAVCADAGLGEVAVLGYSIHGIPAIECAKRRPERFTRAIIAGTPPRGDMQWLSAEATRFFEEDASEERKRVVRENMDRLPPNAALSEALAAQTPLRFFDPGFDYAPLIAEMEASPAMMRHLLGPLTSAWDAAEQVGGVTAPVLIAHGRYDYVVPYRLWSPHVGAFPNATFRLFERSGHQPFFEEPAEFVRAIEAWIAAPAEDSRVD